jgi:hypothetical protein
MRSALDAPDGQMRIEEGGNVGNWSPQFSGTALTTPPNGERERITDEGAR